MADGNGRIWDVIERQRRELLRGERQAAGEMVRAYGETWKRIRGRLDELLQAKVAAEAAGEVIDSAWLYRYERLHILQQQVEGEMRKFVDFAEPVVVDGQQQAVEAARAHSADLVQGMTERAGVSYEFTRLPYDVVEDLVGFTADGSPLKALLDELGPQASASVRNALIEGVATGQGPAAIARRVRQEMGGNLVRALRISRTETLRAYREATRRSYEENSDIIDGWTWVSACTARTCASCWAMHGTVHPLSEPLDDHPNGRCTAIPHLKGQVSREDRAGQAQGQPLQVETGEDQFAKLDPAAQDVILGKAGGLAYRENAVELKQFVGRKRDPDWGTMRSARSLQDIVGKEEARKWVHRVLDQQPRRSLGADLLLQATLQDERLAEVKRLTGTAVENILAQFRAAERLPDLKNHFRMHGHGCGAQDAATYEQMFVSHLQSADLRLATAISTKRKRHRMWFLADVDTGLIAQYNESTSTAWSFYRQGRKFFEEQAALHWIEAKHGPSGWVFHKWTI